MESTVAASEQWERHQAVVREAQSLSALVCAVLQLVWYLGNQVLAAELESRGTQRHESLYCPHCGSRLQSKGRRGRQIQTLLGVVQWKRQVLRCPAGCQDTQRIPSDESLGIAPYEQTSWEVKRLGCLLSVFVPYGLAAHLLEQLSGVRISESSVWNWVQQVGQQAHQRWQERLAQLEAQGDMALEAMSEELEQLLLVLAADGVMVPFRPQEGTAKGKTLWQEVKVGVIARLESVKTATGKFYSRLRQRRLVAMLGDIDSFKPRMVWEALHQGLTQAPQVVWLSDGGKGFWRLYRECFARYAVGILDFYHAAGHLWQAAKAWFGSDRFLSQVCFERWRHLLRHGKHLQVLQELTWLVNTLGLAEEQLQDFIRVQAYFHNHREHIAYGEFEQKQLPLGSGLVESACKWLIQQRFKGVGMRWSEQGFEHLLYLRLAWANQRFDSLFPVVPVFSPNL